MRVIFVVLITLITGTALALDGQVLEANRLELPGGIEISLPATPSDPAVVTEFNKLSPQERTSFYFKRRFIITKLVKGLTRPGLRSGFRWIKNKSFTFLGQPIEDVPTQQTWLTSPASLSPQTKAQIDAKVTSLIENMWQNHRLIAKSTGIGMTFVGGGIFNTTVPGAGFLYGKGRSIDIGVDFTTQSGYMRILDDVQTLRRPGFSMDIGAMFDVLIHVTDPELKSDEALDVTHVKLPMVGCFRGGSNYLGWGMQMGVSVFEMVGAWLAAFGMPAEGAGLIAGIRGVGMATVYSSDIHRRVLKVKNIPEEKMRRIPGFSKLFELARQSQCAELLR